MAIYSIVILTNQMKLNLGNFKRSLYDEIVSFTPEIFYFDKLLNLKAKTQSSSYISQILSSQDMTRQKSISDELVFTLFPDSETIRYGIFNINSLRVLATGSTQKDNFRTPAFLEILLLSIKKKIYLFQDAQAKVFYINLNYS